MVSPELKLKMKKLLRVILITVIISGFGCSKKEEPEKETGVVELSVRMKWFFAGTMSHFFYGKELGIFEEKGLKLTIHSGGPDNNSIILVAAGSDAIGVTSADEALFAIQKGIPIKIIGTLFYKSPIVFISKKNRGLDKFENLKGRKVEIDYGSNAEIQFRAFSEAVGLRKGDYFEQPYTYNLIPFLEDKVDYSVAYEMDQINTLKSKGVEVNVFRPEEVGISLLGDVLICKLDYFDNKKETIDKFLKALREAISISSKNPDKAADALVKSAQGLNPDNERKIYRDTVEFLSYKDHILYNDMVLWEKTFEFLKNQKILEPDKLPNWKSHIYWEDEK